MRRLALIFFLLTAASFGELEQIGKFQQQASNASQEAASAGTDLLASDLLVGKFRYTGQLDAQGKPILPVWFPEYYPRPIDMSRTSTVKPRLKIFQSAISGSTYYVPKYEILKTKSGSVCVPLTPVKLSPPESSPTECLDAIKTFGLDVSQLGSLELSPEASDFQTAFIGITDLNKLSESQKTQYFNGNTPIPSSSDILPKKVIFKKYVADEGNTARLKAIQLQVGGTLLEVPVDSEGSFPPQPNCRIQVADGVGSELQPGQKVSFDFYANSITTFLESSEDNFESSQEVAIPPQQPVASIGTYTKIGTVSYEVPNSPFPGTPANREGTLVHWTIEGRVQGVNRLMGSVDCSPLTVTVKKLLPPACSLVANPINLLKGEKTQLTLQCLNQVSSASIDGAAVSLNSNGAATISYVRKTDASIETVQAQVIGLGGKSNPEVDLGESCPFNDREHRAALWPGGTVSNLFSRANKLQTMAYGHYYVSYDLPAYGRLFGDFKKGFGTPCGVNNFCMRSYQASRSGTGLSINVDGVNWYAYAGGYAYDVEVGPKADASCKVLKTAVRTGGCFASNTRVQMADGQEKLVSEIAENDLIFNPHYQTGVRVRKVVKGPEKKSLYEVQLGKKSIQVTEDHPFLTQRGWVQALALKTGDQLMGEGQGKRVIRVGKLKYQGPQDVWNFELDTEDPLAHVVLANGIPTGDLVTQQELKKGKWILP